MISRACLALALAAVPAGAALGQGLNDRINYLMQQRSAAEAQNTSKAALLGVLLYTDLTVQFQETPARDVFRYLQTVLGINIVPRYNDDRVGYGIDPEALISLDVVERPALNVLELVLDQCAGESFEDCTWQLRNGFVEVGTKERLNLAREIHYYPIRDLLFQVPNFDNAPTLDLDAALNQGNQNQGQGGGGGGGGGFGGGGGGGGGQGQSGSIFGDPGAPAPRIAEEELAADIIEIIQETIEPDSWFANGGDAASVRYYQGTLIIRAPDYIQREVDGYPFVVRPPGAGLSAAGVQPRYLSFKDGRWSVQEGGAPPERGVARTR